MPLARRGFVGHRGRSALVTFLSEGLTTAGSGQRTDHVTDRSAARARPATWGVGNRTSHTLPGVANRAQAQTVLGIAGIVPFPRRPWIPPLMSIEI